MNIIYPPITSNTEFNLCKQRIITELVYNDALDTVHAPSLDCPVLSKVHHPNLLWRARQNGVDGFGGLDYRKVLHAEASCAAIVAAVSLVHKRNLPVVFAPVSGFHHAGWNRSAGFCTFNGLIAAVMHARTLGYRSILIVDGDGHFGDGTDELITHHGLELDVGHLQYATADHIQLATEEILDHMVAGSYDLVLYQAGADAAIDDPSGIGTLSAGELITRDLKLFTACRNAKIPVIWNLAGGYDGAKTLDIHTSTFQTACEVFYPETADARPAIPRGSSVDLSALQSLFD